MKCPNCGNEIADGKLYCESCGAELQVVPELEFDIETEMKKTMSDIVKDDFGNDEEDLEFDDDPNLISMLFNKSKSKLSLIITLVLVIAAIITTAVILGKRISKQTSYEYQMEMAQEALSQNNIMEAISYLKSAYKINPKADILFDIADYYYTIGRENDAISTLSDITEGEFPNVEKDTAYRKLINLYASANNYSDISELLETCTIEDILEQYADYMVFTPEFNIPEGTYEESVYLKISSEGSGNIYYTTDNTTPGTDSRRYTDPVLLEYGSYTVSAVYVNRYGVASEPVTAKYLIDIEFVFEPDILTESGEYTEATLIEAEVPIMYTLYYTTDGSEPSKDSKRYISPISMPVGESTFKFVMYASDGTVSSVVERQYKLEIEAAYTPAEAVVALCEQLMAKGLLSSPGDRREGVNGKILLMYSTIYPIEGYGSVYLVIEYLEDDFGNRSLTGNNYAVGITDLSCFRVDTSGDSYSLIDL